MTDPVTLGPWVGFDVFPVISENGMERPRLEFRLPPPDSSGMSAAPNLLPFTNKSMFKCLMFFGVENMNSILLCLFCSLLFVPLSPSVSVARPLPRRAG